MIPLPSKPKIIKKENNQALFEIEGFYPGYGMTIGNSLRRVLLSSLEGAAITHVKIKGVNHEFSTIPGVLEDVVNVILNLKQLRFKLFTSEPQIATLSIKGEKKVKASDFKVPTQIEIISKDLPVCTLTSKSAKVDMEITIEKGAGYEPVERRKKDKTEIGEIPLDAIYTPVRKVAIKVDNMIVGDRTDYDRLRIDIETDGSISPEEAIDQASKILIKNLETIKFDSKEEEKEEEKGEKGEEESEEKKNLTKTKIEDLDLSPKTSNLLLENKVKTLGGLIKKSEKDLLEFDGLGKKGIGEIKKVLKKMKLELK
jgi:DNA-directed RNA polymerase subunit alpha